MNDKQKEKQKKKLVDAGLMEQSDSLVDFLQANYVERLVGKMGTWKQGWIYFTEERIIFPTGILNQDIVIPYKLIQQIGKCSQGLFPMGITVTYKHPETGEVVTDKFSMSKRQKWIDFLSQKSGVACS